MDGAEVAELPYEPEVSYDKVVWFPFNLSL